jgi:uncharacterized RDD family membrane protein YckC
VDVERMMERVDLDALMARIDVDAIADRIDIDKILEHTEFSSIVAKSTSGVLTEFLALLRRQVVSVDNIVDRIVQRKRRLGDRPTGPEHLHDQWVDTTDGRKGEYAGAFSRLAAITIDVFVAWGLFLLGIGAVQATLSVFFSNPPQLFHHALVAIPIAAVWYFMYFMWQWMLGGRTFGMASVGIRVVTSAGDPVGRKGAVVRLLVLPVSIVVFGLGLVDIVIRPDRRGWHDRAGDTCVVYDWDAKSSRMHWLGNA